MNKLSEKCARNASTLGPSNSANSFINGNGVKSLAVHKFCTKLKHKIEDNLTSSRLTHKLCKGSRHSMSMSSLSGLTDATNGKYTNKSSAKTTSEKTTNNDTTTTKSGMLKHKRIAIGKSNKNQAEKMATTGNAEVVEEQCTPSSSFAGTYIDSDDEYQLPSLSLTKQSLEDEIFEELEKVAHDESKLNIVLKSFDRILTDFHEEIDAKHLLVVKNLNMDENIEEDLKTEQDLVKPLTKNTQIECKDMSQSMIIMPTTKIVRKQLPKKLEKSRSTLGCADTPKFTKQSVTKRKLHSKSVLDVSQQTQTVSRIPIWKAMPLSKRSKSFCNTIPQSLEIVQKPNSTTPMSKSSQQRTVSSTILTAKKLQPKVDRINNHSSHSKKLVKSKTELNVKSKPQNRNNSSKSTWSLAQSTVQQQQQKQQQTIAINKQLIGNLRRSHTNSDELLDKCMEKGQQILKKIESLNIQKTKIITEDKLAGDNLKKYLAQKGRQNSDALSDDSGHISNEADQTHQTLLSESSTSTVGSLCDFEQDSQLNKTPAINNNVYGRSTKISALLEKFETKIAVKPPAFNKKLSLCNTNTTTAATTTATTPTTKNILMTSNKIEKENMCKTVKVAEVQPMHCIETHIEIFPNYSKEVTTWFY